MAKTIESRFTNTTALGENLTVRPHKPTTVRERNRIGFQFKDNFFDAAKLSPAEISYITFNIITHLNAHEALSRMEKSLDATPDDIDEAKRNISSTNQALPEELQDPSH